MCEAIANAAGGQPFHSGTRRDASDLPSAWPDLATHYVLTALQVHLDKSTVLCGGGRTAEAIGEAAIDDSGSTCSAVVTTKRKLTLHE